MIQYLYGDVAKTDYPVATATAVAVGDLVGLTSGLIVNAAGETWDTNEATTRANFVAKYVGVSSQLKVATVARVFGNPEDNKMVVESGEAMYEADAVSNTYTAGNLLGPAKDTGNALLASTLKVVSAENEATHVCTMTTAASATKVKCKQRVPPLMA